MSKSLGNFITIQDLLSRYEAMAVRLFILQAHYRKPIDFTDEALDSTTKGWQTLNEALSFGYEYGEQLGWTTDKSVQSNQDREKFIELVDNDFNFTGGLSVIFDLAKLLRKERNLLIHNQKTEMEPVVLEQKWRTLLELTSVLGLTIDKKISQKSAQISDQEIEELIQKRLEARRSKQYTEGDRIRDHLKNQGVILIDTTPKTTTWHRA
jgi:cysteinyl-tRNA synthetase